MNWNKRPRSQDVPLDHAGWRLPGRRDDGIALFVLNFIVGGVIGVFVLAWRLIVAVCYVRIIAYRLLIG